MVSILQWNLARCFARVSERVENEIDDVLIGQRVHDVFALSAAAYQRHRTQDLESL